MHAFIDFYQNSFDKKWSPTFTRKNIGNKDELELGSACSFQTQNARTNVVQLQGLLPLADSCHAEEAALHQPFLSQVFSLKKIKGSLENKNNKEFMKSNQEEEEEEENHCCFLSRSLVRDYPLKHTVQPRKDTIKQ
jgi:hypothetical protein